MLFLCFAQCPFECSILPADSFYAGMIGTGKSDSMDRALAWHCLISRISDAFPVNYARLRMRHLYFIAGGEL